SKVIYAGTKALWRSSDSGATWKLVYPAPSAIKQVRMNPDHADETIVADPDPLGRFSAFAVDPSDSHILYAIASKENRPALFSSADSAVHWKQIDELPEAAGHLWVDPASPAKDRTLVVAGKHFVTSRKDSHLQVHSTPAELTDVSAGFDSKGGSVLYATTANGLYLSTD